MNQNIKKQNKGFTLLEILLVIAAIGILAAIVLVAINPNKQLAQARNAERRLELNTLYKALEQHLIDNQGYPAGITLTEQDICINNNTVGCVNLGALVPTYIAGIPIDPSGISYKIGIVNGKVRVRASEAELGLNIAISGSGGVVSAQTDPHWNNVSLLLNMNGINGSTTFTDRSNNNLIPNSITGDLVISTAQSKFGGASALFTTDTNLGDWITYTPQPLLEFPGDFTIELWMRVSVYEDKIIASSSSDSNTQVFRINQNGPGTLAFYLNGVQVFNPTAAGINTNTWHHLAISRQGSNTRMFVDGLQKGSTNTTWTGTFRFDVLGMFFFGGSPYGNNNFNGYLDDIRVTKGVARYTSDFTPLTSTFLTN